MWKGRVARSRPALCNSLPPCSASCAPSAATTPRIHLGLAHFTVSVLIPHCRPLHPWQTVLCEYYAAGHCRWGADCQFAHGERSGPAGESVQLALCVPMPRHSRTCLSPPACSCAPTGHSRAPTGSASSAAQGRRSCARRRGHRPRRARWAQTRPGCTEAPAPARRPTRATRWASCGGRCEGAWRVLGSCAGLGCAWAKGRGPSAAHGRAPLAP